MLAALLNDQVTCSFLQCISRETSCTLVFVSTHAQSVGGRRDGGVRECVLIIGSQLFKFSGHSLLCKKIARSRATEVIVHWRVFRSLGGGGGTATPPQTQDSRES
jgi:hypothetical protein